MLCSLPQKVHLHIIWDHKFALPLSPSTSETNRRNPKMQLKRNKLWQNMRNASWSACLKSTAGRRTLAAPLAAKLRACCAPTRASQHQHAAFLLPRLKHKKWKISVSSPCQAGAQAGCGVRQRPEKAKPIFWPLKNTTANSCVAR